MIAAEVLDQLYGGAPEEFVASRTALARAARDAGDKATASAIAELRKPTLAAWAVNVLVRERPVEVERLLDVGARLREAQRTLDVDALRDLRRDRDAVLESFTRAARFVADTAGHTLSMSAATTIRSTAVAALADEKAAEAVGSGCLVRTLEYAGFGEVDLDDAVAAQATARRGSRTPPAATEPHAASAGFPPAATTASTESDAARRRRRERLQQELAEADQELARASLAEAEALRLADKAEARVAELERVLERARAEAGTRRTEATAATRARTDAAAGHTAARERLEAAD